MIDIIPTILFLNHLAIPRYVDSTVTNPIVQEVLKNENPIEYSDATDMAT